MMHEKLIRRLGSPSMIALAVASATACAGTDVLEIDPETRAQLQAMYGGAAGQTGGGAGGSAGMAMGGDDSGGGSAGMAMGGNDSGGGSAGMAMGGDDSGGGAGGSDGGSGGGGTCDGFAVLLASCASGCHNSPSGFGVSEFANDEAGIAAFVGEPSASLGEACGPMLDPADPTASLIYQKVTGTQGGSCGGQMPLGPPLSDADVDCLEDWIGGL